MKSTQKRRIKQAYLNYSDAVFRYIYWQCGDQELAIDLTDKVFIGALRHPNALAANADTDPRTWLYHAAYRLVLDHRHRHPASTNSIGTPRPNPKTPDSISNLDIPVELIRGLAALDEQPLLAVVLRFMEKLKADEIARIMRMDEPSIKMLQFRALNAIKRSLH